MVSFIKRIVLFLAVNILVVVAISFLMNMLGVKPYLRANGIDYGSLLVFCAFMGFVGSFISLQISRFMAKMAMGVQLIDPENPGGPGERELVETVRSLCSRAGLRVLPEIGIYPGAEVNAFATGPSRDRALLAVSAGLLDGLDREAVSGVLGHEIAHIANGDMITMSLLQGVANTFVMFFARILAFMLDNFLRSRSDDDRGGGLGYFGYGIVVFLLETALMLLAMPVVYWFSRQREYRADAGSAELAGRGAMIHALESLKDHSSRAGSRQGSLATLKIHGGAKGLIGMLYSSHPPLDARIRALQRG